MLSEGKGIKLFIVLDGKRDKAVCSFDKKGYLYLIFNGKMYII